MQRQGSKEWGQGEAGASTPWGLQEGLQRGQLCRGQQGQGRQGQGRQHKQWILQEQWKHGPHRPSALL